MAKGGAAPVGAVVGGFACLGLTLAAVAGMVVLSLIGLYPDSTALQGSGAEYRANALMLKGIYTNNSYTFYNGYVVDSSTLSSLCTTMYTKLGITAFTNCVLTNLKIYGNYNTSSTNRRRRRATQYAGGYIVGTGRIFFTTSCEKLSDRSKYGNGSSLSKCASTRISDCTTFFNSSQFQSWTPIPSGFSLVAVDNSSSYQTLTISQMYLVPLYMAQTYLSTFNLTSTSSSLSAGCQYIAPISTSDISSIVAAQSTDTTTQPSTNSG